MSEMWRWVDPRVVRVRLADLHAYLLAHGWQRKPYPQPHVILFEEPAPNGEEPVVQLLPSSEQGCDFQRAVIDTITSLSTLEERHPVEILNEILESGRHDQAAGANGPSRSATAVESPGPGPAPSGS